MNELVQSAKSCFMWDLEQAAERRSLRDNLYKWLLRWTIRFSTCSTAKRICVALILVVGISELSARACLEHRLDRDFRGQPKKDWPFRLFAPHSEVPLSVGTQLGWSKLANRVPLWHIWFHAQHPPPFVRVNIASWRRFERTDGYAAQFVDDTTVTQWIGTVHPSFHLLSKVHKSDYIRQELIYEYGGLYADTDVLCLRDLNHAITSSLTHADANIPQPAFNSSGFFSHFIGPMVPRSGLATIMHKTLWEVMDMITPRLQWCRLRYGNGKGGISYPAHEKNGHTKCGVGWGWLIDPFLDRLKAESPAIVGRVGPGPLNCEYHFWEQEPQDFSGSEPTGLCDVVHNIKADAHDQLKAQCPSNATYSEMVSVLCQEFGNANSWAKSHAEDR